MVQIICRDDVRTDIRGAHFPLGALEGEEEVGVNQSRSGESEPRGYDAGHF